MKKRWEDVSSRGGGKWVITIDPKRRKHDLDGYWLHLVRIRFYYSHFQRYFAILLWYTGMFSLIYRSYSDVASYW